MFYWYHLHRVRVFSITIFNIQVSSCLSLGKLLLPLHLSKRLSPSPAISSKHATWRVPFCSSCCWSLIRPWEVQHSKLSWKMLVDCHQGFNSCYSFHSSTRCGLNTGNCSNGVQWKQSFVEIATFALTLSPFLFVIDVKQTLTYTCGCNLGIMDRHDSSALKDTKKVPQWCSEKCYVLNCEMKKIHCSSKLHQRT